MINQQSKIQPRIHRAAMLLLSGICLCGLLFSCSTNEELEDKLEARNDKYQSMQDRRQIRQNANQERTDAWFDRAMH